MYMTACSVPACYTPTLLPINKRRKGSSTNWRNQGRCCIPSYTQILLTYVMFAAAREVKLYFVARLGAVEIASKSIAKSVIKK